jgi:hypothetical protein
MITVNSINTPNTVSHATWEDVISDVRILSELDELNARRSTEGIPESWIAPFTIKSVNNPPLTAVENRDAGVRYVSDTIQIDDIVAPRPVKPINFQKLFILDRCSLPGSPPSSPGSLYRPLNDTPSLASDDSTYQSFSLFGSPLTSPRTLEDAPPANEGASAESFPNAEGSPSPSKELSGCERPTRVSKRQRYKVNPYDPACLRRSQRLRLKAEEGARKQEHC